MRTPDEETSSGDGGSLAGGFGATHDEADASAETEEATPTDFSGDDYGTGFTEVSTETFDPFVEDVTTGVDAEADPSLYDVDPGDVATDTDLDFNSDGVVDDLDVVEGATALFSFGFEHAHDSHDPAADPAGDHHLHHHDDGGLLDA